MDGGDLQQARQILLNSNYQPERDTALDSLIAASEHSGAASMAVAEYLYLHQNDLILKRNAEKFLEKALGQGQFLAAILLQAIRSPWGGEDMTILREAAKRAPFEKLRSIISWDTAARLAFYRTCDALGARLFAIRLCRETLEGRGDSFLFDAYAVALNDFERRRGARQDSETRTLENLAIAEGYRSLADKEAREAVVSTAPAVAVTAMAGGYPFSGWSWGNKLFGFGTPPRLLRLSSSIVLDTARMQEQLTESRKKQIALLGKGALPLAHICYAFRSAGDFVSVAVRLFDAFDSVMAGLDGIFARNVFATYLQFLMHIPFDRAHEAALATQGTVQQGGEAYLASCYARLLRNGAASTYLISSKSEHLSDYSAAYSTSFAHRLKFQGMRCLRKRTSSLKRSYASETGRATGRIYGASERSDESVTQDIGYYFIDASDGDPKVILNWCYAVSDADGAERRSPPAKAREEWRLKDLEALDGSRDYGELPASSLPGMTDDDRYAWLANLQHQAPDFLVAVAFEEKEHAAYVTDKYAPPVIW